MPPALTLSLPLSLSVMTWPQVQLSVHPMYVKVCQQSNNIFVILETEKHGVDAAAVSSGHSSILC